MGLLPAFTSLYGSLLHPVLMSVIICMFIVTFILGLQARQKRLSPLGEETGLLSGAVLPDKRHHKLSALLVLLSTAGCFLGMGNTFARTGRLFPGPHLWGGLGVLLALSANVSLVPWFKDAPRVRTVHALIGFAVLVLLGNQVKSGIKLTMGIWRHFH